MSYQIEERFIELKQHALADSKIIIAHESGNVLIDIGNISKNKDNKTHYWISSQLGGANHRNPDDWLARFGINLSQFASDLADHPKEDSLQIVSLQETHLVLFGDTLWSIAKKHQTTVTWLKKLNHLPSDHIKSGTVLLLTSAQIEMSFFNQSIKKRTEIIKMIQKNCGTIIDGLFGPITKKALLCLFQEAIHAPVDGLWGANTATLVRNIQVKTKGKDVYAVQAMLFGFGYEVVGIPDCIVGDLTRQAILLFQKEQHLVCEGIAGKKTLSILFQ